MLNLFLLVLSLNVAIIILFIELITVYILDYYC